MGDILNKPHLEQGCLVSQTVSQKKRGKRQQNPLNADEGWVNAYLKKKPKSGHESICEVFSQRCSQIMAWSEHSTF